MCLSETTASQEAGTEYLDVARMMVAKGGQAMLRCLREVLRSPVFGPVNVVCTQYPALHTAGSASGEQVLSAR